MKAQENAPNTKICQNSHDYNIAEVLVFFRAGSLCPADTYNLQPPWLVNLCISFIDSLIRKVRGRWKQVSKHAQAGPSLNKVKQQKDYNCGDLNKSKEIH